MAKARAFALDESVLNENEETIEVIMAKARAFALEESFLDEEY